MAGPVACPACAARFVPPAESGHVLQCPKCGESFRTDTAAFGLAQTILGGLDKDAAGPESPPLAAEKPLPSSSPLKPLTFEAQPRRASERSSARLPSDPLDVGLPSAEPPKGNGKGWSAGLGTVAVILLFVLRACSSLTRHEPIRQPAFQMPPAFNAHKPLPWERPMHGDAPLAPSWDEPDAPFVLPQTDAQRDREILGLVESLRDPIARQDVRETLSPFDWGRFAQRLEEIGGINRATTRNVMFRQSVARAMSLHLFESLPTWSHLELQSVRNLGKHDTGAVIRFKNEQNQTWVYRWRLSRRVGRWTFFDIEYLDCGNCISSTIVSAPETNYPEPIARESMQLVSDAFGELNMHNEVLAEPLLKQVEAKHLRGAFPTLFAIAQVRVHQANLRWNDMLEALKPISDKADAFPAIEYLSGVAKTRMMRSDQAIPHLSRFLALSGKHTLVLFELGEAYRMSGRLAEAAPEYRAGLDLEPKQGYVFLGLIRVLGPADPRDDLAERFEKLEKREENFQLCLNECRTGGKWETMEVLARAMLRLEPGHPDASICHATALAGLGKTDDAVRAFRKAPAFDLHEIAPSQDAINFVQQMSRHGKVREAYAAFSDPEAAFPKLVVGAKTRGLLGQMRQLAAEHAKKFPDDPLVKICKAETLALGFDDAAADKLFDEAFSQKLDRTVESAFQPTRLAVRFRLGKAIATYQESRDKHQAFAHLEGLCRIAQDQATLDKLVELHAKVDPTNPVVQEERAARLLKQGKGAEAVKVLFDALRNLDRHAREDSLADFSRAMIDADVERDAYLSMPDADEVFRSMGFELLYQRKTDRLAALNELHRKRSPNDPWLARFEAEVAMRKKDYATAADKYRASLQAKGDAAVRMGYLRAMANAGRGAEAFAAAKADPESLRTLGDELARHKRWAELDAVLKAYADKNAKDATYLSFAARLMIGKEEWKQAEAILAELKKAVQDTPAVDLFVSPLAHAYLDAGRPLEGYRLSPRPDLAFAPIARQLADAKKIQELTTLLGLHEKAFPHDVNLPVYRAEEMLLRGDADGALRVGERANTGHGGSHNYLLKAVLDRALVRKGDIKTAYANVGESDLNFRQLAEICFREKKADLLPRLLKLHAANDPDDPELAVRRLQHRYQENDFKGVVGETDRLLKERTALPVGMRALRIRSQIRLQRFDEASREAETASKRFPECKYLQLLALAAKGDVAAVQATMEKFAADDVFFVHDCYADVELGAILREAKFADVRARFPEGGSAILDLD